MLLKVSARPHPPCPAFADSPNHSVILILSPQVSRTASPLVLVPLTRESFHSPGPVCRAEYLYTRLDLFASVPDRMFRQSVRSQTATVPYRCTGDNRLP